MTTDRDQSIERLLRRARSADPHAPDHCPDAETLAALADDTLTAAARREVEAHVADCHRCQALTAAMVRAEASTGTLADEAAGEVPSWKRRALNWLVPAAAAATAVVLWVLVPGQRTPLPEEPTPEGQIAATPPAAPPEAASSEPLQAPPEAPRSEPVQAPADARADRPARGRTAAVEQDREAAAAPPPPARAEAPLKPEESLSREARSADARSERATSLQERALSDAAAPAASAPAALSAAGSRAAVSFDVVSPNPRIRWRVGPGPVVQHSADGGARWSPQQTGASVELTAGSAPAPEVCWLVGRGGIVLRTTDEGRQWQRTAFPETVDLTAVTASNALSAIVNLADGRRFRTTDGGRTWAPVRE
jgi:hypothetical protein